MKKMLFFASALVLMGSYGYAQSDNGEDHSSGTESSVHGSTVSDLAQNTTVTGKEKGSLISSAARAKALTVANANARFLRGDAKPTNGNGSSNATANANANAIANANVNSVLNSSSSTTLNGKPSTLPPVTPPTTGQPLSTPVGAPMGVPVGVQAVAHVAAGLSHH